MADECWQPASRPRESPPLLQLPASLPFPLKDDFFNTHDLTIKPKNNEKKKMKTTPSYL